MTQVTGQVAPQQPSGSMALAGMNTMIMGPAGTGKTYAIGTAVEAGLEVFYLALEPGLESLLGYFTDKGKPVPPNLHWHTVKPPTASFAELINSAQMINSMTLDALAKMQDTNKAKYNQFVLFLQALSNFVDERTGEKFGSVDTWDTSRLLVIDGLTGLNKAVMSMVIGGKPVRSQADWGIAQDQLERIISMLCNNCKCHFTLIAHVERETDQVLGGVKIMASTLGKAMAPKLPPMFSDVILATRAGDKWTWDTASALADVKTRNLPISSTNAPDFRLLLEKWKNRQALTK